MTQYQVYARHSSNTGWNYLDTFDSPSTAWQALLLTRARDCEARVVIARKPTIGIDLSVVEGQVNG